MAANNMINPAVDPANEDQIFAREVDEVKRWWSDSRWRHTKRPFTAEQIVSKRGTLKIEYASNAQSKKLWKILEGRFQVSHIPVLVCRIASALPVGAPLKTKNLTC
jgi:isocitrate lyase